MVTGLRLRTRLMIIDRLSLLLLCIAYFVSSASGQIEHSPQHPAGNDEPSIFRLSFQRKDEARTLSGFTSIAPSYQCTIDVALFFLELHQPSVTSPPFAVMVSESLPWELR